MHGRIYGKWTIMNLLDDSSGNGTVWCVSDRSGVQGAIKILKQFDSIDKALKRRARFTNEIKKLEVMMQMGIAGVMPILDYSAIEGEQPWFVMPLAHKLQPREDRVNWAVETIVTVSQTIAELHAEGIVHRDIKPNNILVLNDKVVVSDFGLARTTDDDAFTNTGEGVGSYGYTAPESIGHSDEPQFKCDVFSLAKTAWVLLTGSTRPPLGELGHSNDTFMNHGISSDTILLKQLEELLVASTQRDPNDRPTAKQFLEGIKSCRRSDIILQARKPSSPADRARVLFSETASKNRRDKECRELFRTLTSDASNRFRTAWGNVIENLGWPVGTSSGGRSGTHTLQLSNNWEIGARNFFRGEINNVVYEIALTCRRLRTIGEARLVCGATIAIQRDGSEYILASTELETFTSGPQVEQVRRSLFAFVENEETQYRMIEKLKELSNT